MVSKSKNYFSPMLICWNDIKIHLGFEDSYFVPPPTQNLPRLEDVLFQGLGAWRIIFFYFQNHFPKIHAQKIPKMSDFYVFGPFLAEKMAL